MPHCLNCGNDEPDDLVYCTRCGRQLELQPFEDQAGTLPYIPAVATDQIAAFTNPNTAAPSQPPTVVVPAKGRISGLWLLLLLPVMGLCAIAGVLGKLAYDSTARNAPVNSNTVANTSANCNEGTVLDTDDVFENLNAETDNIMANFNATLKKLADEENRSIKKVTHKRP